MPHSTEESRIYCLGHPSLVRRCGHGMEDEKWKGEQMADMIHERRRLTEGRRAQHNPARRGCAIRDLPKEVRRDNTLESSSRRLASPSETMIVNAAYRFSASQASASKIFSQNHLRSCSKSRMVYCDQLTLLFSQVSARHI
jgi:hypothetical protein